MDKEEIDDAQSGPDVCRPRRHARPASAKVLKLDERVGVRGSAFYPTMDKRGDVVG